MAIVKNILWSIAAVLWAAAIGACASDEPVTAPNSPGVDAGASEEGGSPVYLSFEIGAVPTGHSRATDPPTGDDSPGTPGDFQVGTEYEQKISTLTYFFFTNDGLRFDLSTFQGVENGNDHKGCNRITVGPNLIDPDTSNPAVSAWGNDDATNIEHLVRRTLRFRATPTQYLPLRLYIVANATPELLTALDDVIYPDDHNPAVNLTNYLYSGALKSEAGMVMINDTHLNSNLTGFDRLTTIFAKDFYPTPGESQSKPVRIDLERNLAKIEATFPTVATDPTHVLTENDKTYYWVNYGKQGDPTSKNSDDAVFVNFEGIGPVPEVQNPYFFKDLNEFWKPGKSGYRKPFEGWFSSTRFRTYWAMNPLFSDIDFLNRNFEEITSTPASPIYVRENTNRMEGTSHDQLKENYTQIVFTGKLYRRNKTTRALEPWNHASYISKEYGYAVPTAGDPNPAAVANDIRIEFVNMLRNQEMTKDDPDNYRLCYKGSDGKLKEMEAKHIAFAPVSETHGGETVWHYRATASLSAGSGATKAWVKGVPGADWTDQETTVSNANLNSQLRSFGSVKIWNGGRCYYYVPVKHIAYDIYSADPTPAGYKGLGVVRNHWYRIEVEAIKGVGTPVPDPTKPITPEHPSDQEENLHVRVTICPWRTVDINTDIDW